MLSFKAKLSLGISQIGLGLFVHKSNVPFGNEAATAYCNPCAEAIPSVLQIGARITKTRTEGKLLLVYRDLIDNADRGRVSSF